MTIEPGRILLVAYPFSDHTAAKIRPALVVSSRKFNVGGDFVVVPLSSRITQGDSYAYHILDTHPDFEMSQLRCSSSVKWTKPMVINRSVVHRELGSLSRETLREIQALVQSMFV